MMITVNETEMGFCETCGNYVPAVEDQGDLVCGYEFAEYPEFATVLRQRVGGWCQSLVK